MVVAQAEAAAAVAAAAADDQGGRRKIYQVEIFGEVRAEIVAESLKPLVVDVVPVQIDLS